MVFDVTYLHNYMGMNVAALHARFTLPKPVKDRATAMQFLLANGGWQNDWNDGQVIGNFIPVTAIIAIEPA